MVHTSIQSQINNISKQMPNKIAIEYGNNQVTYSELESHSNSIAYFFKNKIAQSKNILIFMERKPELVYTILGVIKAGGVFVPLDPGFPENRIKNMIEEVESYWVVAETAMLDKLNDIFKSVGKKMNVLIPDLPAKNYNNYANLNLYFVEHTLLPADLYEMEIAAKHCYIYFTSGSTGTPKGILGRHRSLKHFIDWEIKELAINDSFRISQFTTPSFDASLRDIFVPLCSGGTLCIPENRDIILDFVRMYEWIEKNRISLMHMVPSVFRGLMDIVENPMCFEQLRYILLAGEMLRGNDVKKFFEILGRRVHLINLYGATETTLVKTFYNVKESDVAKANLPVGKPIDGTEILILDKDMERCSVGSVGEIFIRTPYITSGYFNDKELTRKVFIRNPFSNNQQDILYKTGDLGVVLPDGNVECMGRIDNQVKVRGIRIELGEIEHVLMKHENVKEAAVIAKEHGDEEKVLCAYMVGENKIDILQLREYLKKNLPEYMLPLYFMQIDKMPLTPNGKVDRRALPAPDGIIDTGIEYVAPHDELEAKLVAIWQEVLGIERIGINDSFFDLGGHSLKATIMGAKVHKELSVQIPLKEIFTAPTIRLMGDYIRKQAQNSYSRIEKIEEQPSYTISSAQKRLYAIHKLEPNAISYNMPLFFEIEGALDIARLEKAFRELIKRHESLRTSFEMEEEEIVQKVQTEVAFSVEHRETMEGFVRIFDLSTAPLMRAGLVKLQSDRSLLLIDMHHIISDGTSMGILIREFSELYQGKELPALRLQYKDYCAWQVQAWQNELFRTQEEYWLKQFEGEVPVLNLPTDYQRPAVQSFEGNSIGFEIDKDRTNKLRQIAKDTGSTMYMVLLSTFNILLSKYSGQEDIIVGSPIAGRPHADLENIIGMFVNTLAMRNYPSGEKTFREFLREVKENALAAYENQDYQFEELVEKLDVARDFSRNPVFDVMFVLQNMDIGDTAVEGIKIRQYKSENMVSKFDMTVNAVELGNIISISIQYCTKLFGEATIERMYKHLENIIQAVTENIDTKLSEINILTKEERRQILIDFNNTKRDYPKDKTIHQLFEEQVMRTPDDIAVVYEEKSLTYGELNERANQLAWELRSRGIVGGNIVAIIVEHSLEMVIGVLGILKAGGAYLPIDPDYSVDRIKYMLKDSHCNILLCSNTTAKELELDIDIILLSDGQQYAQKTNNLENINKSQDLAYVMYTSGSTGKPKGVLIEHMSVVRLVKNTNYIDFSKCRRILQTGALVFDASTFEIWGSLLNGLSLYLVNKEVILDVAKLKNELMRNHIDTIWLTSSLFSQLASEDAGIFKECKYLLSGGDVLSVKHINAVRKECKGLNIVNGYGPTENTTFSVCHIIDKDYTDNIPIGKPISNSTAYIVDKNNKLCPIGVVGELCVAGDGLAREYLNSPELTAEKFVENSFEQGTRMYRTGDLARWLPDGNIEFYGRVDHQVKLRGFRIELGEIESNLLSHQAIKEAVVIAKEDSYGIKYLCAYIAATEELTAAELKAHLKKELPDHMLPVYYIQLEKLPLTPNGKLDRKALKKSTLPDLDGNIIAGTEYEAPRDELEEKLAAIWQEVLGIEKIGINDNFFELGGSSLRAMALTARIHKVFDVEIPLREIFEVQKLKELADKIKAASNSIYSSIEPVEQREYYPVSSAQKRMYVLSQFEGMNINYNIPGALLMYGDMDKGRLKEVFDALIARHESLRTSFHMVNEELVQKIHQEVDFCIEYFKTAEEKGEDALIKDFISPFDLGKAPLLRIAIIELPDNKNILLSDMHHIISDGVSIEILTNEFIKLYNGEKLNALRIQYKDFSQWQEKILKSEAMAKQEAYWKHVFKEEIPALNMPTDYQRPFIQSFEGEKISFDISSEITGKLKKLAADTGTTLYMVLLATYNVLLSKYTGQDDIVVGTPIAGRPHADLENIIGMFVNTLAMRNYPNENKTFKEFLFEIKENALKAYENQDYQFDTLVEKLEVKRDFSRNPIFDVMFTLQDKQGNAAAIENTSFEPYKFSSQVSKFDMTLQALECDENIIFNLEYGIRLFKKETIQRLIVHFKNILKDITENPAAKLCEIDILSQEEKLKLLVEFNNTEAAYPKYKTLHQLFEEQVERTPQNVAVLFEKNELTYRQLNNLSNKLAMRLMEEGVKPGSIVGIVLRRSIEMLVSILGVLKAGGAYLPMDPSQPGERLKYMLEECKVSILISEPELVGDLNYDGICINTHAIELCKSGDLIKNTGMLNAPTDPAYIIYTSGTTGNPKGVLVGHDGISNTIQWRQNEYRLDENDRVLQLFPYIFDGFLTSFFTPIVSGAAVVLINEDNSKNAVAIADIIKIERITHFIAVPQLFESVLELLDAESAETMRIVSLAGDKMNSGLAAKCKEINDRLEIINEYGPTECSVAATFNRNVAPGFESIIGKPIANTRIYIVDNHYKIQPIGVPGELCIGGEGLAKGYINNAKLTDEKFVCNPFEKGKLMYRTGDMARWLPEGDIEFLGRIDQQIKIRGFRIEPGEIEAPLRNYPSVSDAVIVELEDNKKEKFICAYFIASNKIQLQALKAYLLEKLPEYMLPSFMLQVDEIPRTASGKVDKKRLPDARQEIITELEYVVPQKEVEKQIAGIWEEVLGIEKIGINYNFFDLGGNSLKLLQMHAKIEKLYPGKLHMTDIFASPTVKKIAAIIESQLQSDLKLECLMLPDEFFEKGSKNSIPLSLSFEIEKGICESLKSIAQKEAVKLDYIFIALFSYLLCDISGCENIHVQTMVGKNNLVIPMSMMTGNISTIAELISSCAAVMEEGIVKGGYNLDMAESIAPAKEECDVLPMIYHQKLMKYDNNLSNIYDILFGYSINNENIIFRLKFSSRIKPKKARELADKFTQMIELTIGEYKD